jgi:hypothetical protein
LLANTALGLTVSVTWFDLSRNKKKQKQNSQPLITIPVIMNKLREIQEVYCSDNLSQSK